MHLGGIELGDAVEFLDSQRVPVREELRKPGPYPYYGANGRQGTIDGYIFDEPLVLLAEDAARRTRQDHWWRHARAKFSRLFHRQHSVANCKGYAWRLHLRHSRAYY